MSISERHSAARIDSNASSTGCWAITVQPTLAARTDSATTGLPSSPVVATADPLAALTTDLSRLKSPEPPSLRSTRLMSGWAIRRPESSTTRAWPVSPILIAAMTSQISFRLMSAMTIAGGRAVSGDGDPHVGLGIALILHGAVPDPVGACAHERRGLPTYPRPGRSCSGSPWIRTRVRCRSGRPARPKRSPAPAAADAARRSCAGRPRPASRETARPSRADRVCHR